MAEAICRLPERLQFIFRLQVQAGWTGREVALLLRVTEGRISQLKKKLEGALMGTSQRLTLTREGGETRKGRVNGTSQLQIPGSPAEPQPAAALPAPAAVPEKNMQKEKAPQRLGHKALELCSGLLGALVALVNAASAEEREELGLHIEPEALECCVEGCHKDAGFRDMCEGHYAAALLNMDLSTSRAFIHVRFEEKSALGPSAEADEGEGGDDAGSPPADVSGACRYPTVAGISSKTLERMVALYRMVQSDGNLGGFILNAAERAPQLGYKGGNPASAFGQAVRMFSDKSGGEIKQLGVRGHWKFTERGIRNMKVRLAAETA